jgi:hypothetical protein
VVPIAGDGLTVVAATWLEARACRRALPGRRVEAVGVGCRRGLPALDGPALVVGLCGALGPIAPGTVAIPREVAGQDGWSYVCQPELVERLVSAARRLGLAVDDGRQLTARRMITGPDRAEWAARGFATVDMEAALVLARTPGAVVKVVLDAPGADLSPEWEHPGRAALRVSRWAELAHLMLRAPAFAADAARVVATAIET